MTGAEAACKALHTLGVDCVFGVPGTQNVELFEALRGAHIRTVLASHELAASFMANGYFRATGRPGVLLTIPGPGFTYALTGLAEARLDSAALLYLVGAPAAGPGQRFQLQSIDQLAIAAPLVKQSFSVAAASDIAPAILAAHRSALDGEPGPVMVQIAGKALAGEAGDVAAAQPAQPAVDPEADLRELEQLFARAQRPVLLVGQGALSSADAVRRIVERRTIPIVTTPSARGILPEDHPLACAFDVLRGHVDVVNELFRDADLIVALGCKLSHNGSAGFQLRLPAERLVHVDVETAVLGANYPARLSVVATADTALARMESAAIADGTKWSAKEIEAIRKRLRVPAAQAVEPVIQGKTALAPAAFFTWLREALPRDAILVTDSGLHQILARRHFDVLSPRGLIVPSDFQSMGFGLPAAIGVKVAAPHRPVVALIGDGGFLMSGLELLTAVRERLPLLVIVFNDGKLNQIRLQQLESFGRAHAVSLENPDFAALAYALGAGYLRFGAAAHDDVRAALNTAGPTLLEVAIGDSAAIRSMRRRALAKALGRRVLGARLKGWMKKLLRRQGA